jgi:hypothetical protein
LGGGEAGGWGREGGYPTCSYCPHGFGGGGARTPSCGGSAAACYGLTPCIYLGGGAGNADDSTYWRDRHMARNPRRPAAPLWGGDTPRAPGGGENPRVMGGHAAEPSSRTPAPRPAPALTPLAGSGAPPSAGPCGPCSCRADVGHSKWPLPTAPPPHGNQALAADSATRRRSVDGAPPCWGSACLRNGPRPRKSGSHLSGCSPPP